jgi:hypothetical protein
MSRIKYPGEQEMKRQIQVILDESGMFEDDEKSQGYTECVQVKKRPAVKTAILFPLAAAAVMFLVVTADTAADKFQGRTDDKCADG